MTCVHSGTIVCCCSLVRPQRSRSSQLYVTVSSNLSAYISIRTGHLARERAAYRRDTAGAPSCTRVGADGQLLPSAAAAAMVATPRRPRTQAARCTPSAIRTAPRLLSTPRRCWVALTRWPRVRRMGAHRLQGATSLPLWRRATTGVHHSSVVAVEGNAGHRLTASVPCSTGGVSGGRLMTAASIAAVAATW